MIAPRYVIFGTALVGVLGYTIYRPAKVAPVRGSTMPEVVSATGGYLSPAALPEGLEVLPPPPAANSTAMKKDEDARQVALKLQGTPRWARAAADASRAYPNMLQGFSCAFGTEITKERMPRLYQLLSRVQIDVRRSTYGIKNRYKRP